MFKLKAEKKQMIWPFLAIVAIVAVVGIVMLVMNGRGNANVVDNGNVAGEVLRPPLALANIKANSCNADEQCEVKNLVVTGKNQFETLTTRGLALTGGALIGDDLSVASDLTVGGDAKTRNLVVTGTNQFETLTARGLALTGGALIGDDLLVSSDLTITGLANPADSNSKAYVCVNKVGQLYRSEVACS